MKHIISICICVLCSILSCSAKVERYKIEVVKAYPHAGPIRRASFGTTVPCTKAPA